MSDQPATQEVPGEFLQLGIRALSEQGHRDRCGCSIWPRECVSGLKPDRWRDEATELLASVLAAHEAMVRAAAADEIEGEFGPFQIDDTDPYAPDVVRYLRGLCINCGRGPDDELCGVLHMFRAGGDQ